MPIVKKKFAIDETLWRTARAAAALEGKTVSEWISEKLRAELAGVLPPEPGAYLPPENGEEPDGAHPA